VQVVYPKSEDQRQRLSDNIRNILLFRNLEPVSDVSPENSTCTRGRTGSSNRPWL